MKLGLLKGRTKEETNDAPDIQLETKGNTKEETERVPDVQAEAKEKKKRGNTNPFEGAVGEDVVVVDPQGNAIPVKEGNWLGGSKDGTWIQEKEPGKDLEGEASGFRKDGGGHAREKDIRAREPHAHVPGVTNPDGTPWLPIK